MKAITKKKNKKIKHEKSKTFNQTELVTHFPKEKSAFIYAKDLGRSFPVS